jgi:RNA polymerase sigma-32 factor
MAMATHRYPNRAFDVDLAAYFRKIGSYPLLTEAEETALTRRYRRTGDRAAAEALVAAHLRLVARVAQGYRGYGMPIDDLIAEGNVGLLQALKGFDPDRGARFATYALWWIRAAIQEYILRSWSLVRVGTSAAQKKLFFNLRRIKADMKILDNHECTPEQVARISDELDVNARDVVQMERRMAGSELSLNAPIGDRDAEEWLDRVCDEEANQENALAEKQESNRRRAFLRAAIERLTDRERSIIRERRLKERPTTLQTLSERYAITRERVRQIEIKALDKLRKTARGPGAVSVG